MIKRPLLYLGEINDSQRAQWCSALDVLDPSDGSVKQMGLFPEDHTPPPEIAHPIQIKLRELTLRRARQWGGCWLALELWNQLKLDEFWAARLPASRKGIEHLNVLKTLTSYRLLDPGSEWRLHRDWFKNSATVTNGLAYQVRQRNGGGITAVYDRTKRRACVQTSPR